MAGNAPSPGPSRPQYPHTFSTNGPTSRNITQPGGLNASPRLRLLVSGLPPKTSTLDIYENFCRYGSVVRIYLFETREGFKSTRAEVDFEPAPTHKFWHRSLNFETRSRQSAEIRCQLSNPPQQHYLKESPARKGVKYEDRTELYGKSLDFGVLTDPTKMMVMARSGSMQQKPKLVLNLHRKEIEVQFPWQQISANRSAVRTFRFIIALDEEFKIWQLSDRSFVLHLTKPPWYSKQLAEAIANTHSPDAQMWNIEDTWARQTDLWTYKQRIPEINSSPVALPKHFNDINIFRWTTFRFDPVGDAPNISAALKFVDALRDWNVKVLSGSSFEVSDALPDLDRTAWKLINGTHSDKTTLSEADLSQIQLLFSVRYQLEVCLSHGWLSEYSITPDFLRQLSEWPEARARQALLYVAMDQKRLFDPMVIFSSIHYSKPVRAKRLPDNCIEICSATVTSTGILFHTPAVEITNRIIRNHKSHAHRFLRVRFEDDVYRGQTRLYPSTNNKMVMIFTRVKRALVNGIKLGNVTYDFLAWGNSQLREHGAYFFASSDELTADAIRAEMGDFEETVVAKKAARMGQCFSTTRPVRMHLRMIHEPDAIPDIVRNGYTFTDGVGKISPAAAALVASQLQIKGPIPCLFQFRLGGCKGVLAVSEDVPGVDVRIRKSQLKFKSLSNELEINRYAQFWQSSLNRQIILCLSSLGVPTEVFIRKQDETIVALNRAMQDDSAAINALRSNIDPNMMTLSLSHLVEAGFRESQEPFVVTSLELWRAWSLKSLKEKAKIPIEKGAFVLGTVDETATLQGHTDACPSGYRDAITKDPAYLEKLPEIFLQITDHKTGKQQVIEGICILARNPSLHRGDIRVVRARDVPALHHMCDVVVMPQLGERDLPSMCSGGDLDGDDYIVIWDQDLIPRFWNADPFHYDPPVPKMAAGEIKTSDLIDFFHDYMQNDALGKIANAHLAAADFLDNGLESGICLDLVQLHSMAVDYPKTGVAAKMERRLERTQKPHFMEQKHGRSYRSHKVLGQLYDKINKFYEKTGKEAFVKYDLEFDSRILDAFNPDTELLNKVEAVKRSYDISLRRILTQHSIRTEFELWTTFVLEHSKKSRDYKFHEEVGDLSRILKEEYYEELCDLAGGRDFDHLAPIAVTAYKLARNQLQAAKAQAEMQHGDDTVVEMPFISFPWVLQDTLIKISSQTGHSKRPATTKANDSCEDDAKSGLEAAEDATVDGLHDVANFHLTRDKLSPYLPDPLTAKIAASVQDEAGEKTEEVCVDVELTAVPEARATLLYEGPNTAQGTKQPQQSTLRPLSERTNSDHGLAVNEDPSTLSAQTPHVSEEAMKPDSRIQRSLADFEGVETNEKLSQEVPNNENHCLNQIPAISAHSSPKLQYKSPSGIRSRRQATCFYWRMNGSCKYTENECKYAHYDTGFDMPEKQLVTCTFSAETCKFAHYDTGYYAPQPHGSTAPTTKRIVVDAGSDSDDTELLPLSKSAPRSPWKAKPNYPNEEYASRQERVNRRNYQQPPVFTDLNFGTGSTYVVADDNDVASRKKSERKSSIDKNAAADARTDLNRAVPSHETDTTQASSSRISQLSPRAKELSPESVVSDSRHASQPQSQPQSRHHPLELTGQQATPTGPSHSSKYYGDQSYQRGIKNTSPYDDDLKDLVIGNLMITSQKGDTSGSDGGFTVITPRTPDSNYSLLANDLIDLKHGGPKQNTLPIHQTVPVEAKPNTKKAPSVSSDLLLDDFEITRPNELQQTSRTQDPLLLTLTTAPNSLDNSMGHLNPVVPVKTTFNDPLTSGENGEDEPEIEELFD